MLAPIAEDDTGSAARLRAILRVDG